jgi:protein TonB
MPSANAAKTIPGADIEAPTFSDLAVKDHEAAATPAGKSRLPMLAVAVVVLAAAGYFGWTKIHPASQAQSPATAQPVTATPVAQATDLTQTQPASAVVTADATPRPTAGAFSAKPSPAKPIQDEEPDVITIMPATHQQPMIVNAAPEKSQAAGEPAPVLPGAIGIPSSGDTKQIAGIVASAPTAIPRATPQTLRISQGVSQGLLIKKVQPVYPQAAQQMRLQGAVQLQASISKTGDIANVKVLSGDPILAHAAADAVRRWKYKPYYLNGEAVEIQTEITVNFKLP